MLYNGKTQSRSSGGFGTALVHPVKPLKHSLLRIRRDSDSRVLHPQFHALLCVACAHYDASVFVVVTDRVITQVVKKLLHHLSVRLNLTGFPLKRQSNMVLLRRNLQHVHTGLCGKIQADVLLRRLFLLTVQLGQSDDIVDKGQQSVRIFVNTSGKPPHILIGRHSRFDQLRITRNGGKRRFQLMGHICGKLLSDQGIFHNVLMLRLNHVDKGLQFLISGNFIRLIQTLRQLLDRCHQPLCQEMGHDHTKDDQHNHDQCDHRHCPVKNAPDAARLSGHTQHAAILQKSCIVEGTPPHGIGMPDGYALSFFPRLQHLRSSAVIVHGTVVRLAVKQYASVLPDEGHSKLRGIRKRPFLCLIQKHFIRHQPGICPQILNDLVPVQFIKDGADQKNGGKDRHRRNCHQLKINLLFHRLLFTLPCQT